MFMSFAISLSSGSSFLLSSSISYISADKKFKLDFIVNDGKQFEYDYSLKKENWDFEIKSYRGIFFAMIRISFRLPKNIDNCLSFSIKIKKIMNIT